MLMPFGNDLRNATGEFLRLLEFRLDYHTAGFVDVTPFPVLHNGKPPLAKADRGLFEFLGFDHAVGCGLRLCGGSGAELGRAAL